MSTINLGNVRGLIAKPTAPSNKDLLWRDTSANPHVIKYYNTQTELWESLVPSSSGVTRELNPGFTATSLLQVDWNGKNEYMTTGDIVLNLDSIVSLANGTNAGIALLDILVTGATRVLTFPVATHMQQSDTRWNPTNRELTLEVGRYKLTIKRNGSGSIRYTVECSDKYITT